MRKKIPFNQNIYKSSLININKLRTLSYDGNITKKTESMLKKIYNCKKIFLTKSATAALEATAFLIDIKKNDEIIMPSFNYFSAAYAFLLRGARIKFADINLEDLNLSLNDTLKKINSRTRVIVLTHYAGKSCNLKEFLKIAFLNATT